MNMSFTIPHAVGPKRIEKKLSALIQLHGNSDFTVLDDEEILQEYEQDMHSYGIPDHLEVHDILDEPLLGKGVFLCPEDDPIEKNEFIAVYSGEYKLLTDEDTFDGSYTFEVLMIKAKGKKREALKKLGFALPETAEEVCLYVDAKDSGNYARYINNSTNPNVEAVIELVRGRPEVIYRACRRIYPGEQLLVDYTESYWEPMGITPLQIESDSFMLTKQGKIVSGEAFYMESGVRKKLAKMVSTLPGKTSKKGEAITPALGKKINEFEKILFKRHIDPRMYIRRVDGKEELWLRPGKKVRKGTFLGLYSPNNFFSFAKKGARGTLSLKPIYDPLKKRTYLGVYATSLLTDSKAVTIS